MPADEPMRFNIKGTASKTPDPRWICIKCGLRFLPPAGWQQIEEYRCLCTGCFLRDLDSKNAGDNHKN